MIAGAAPQLKVMTPPRALAACSAAAVQLAAVPLPTTRAPAVLAWEIGAVQTAGGAASALAVAATVAAASMAGLPPFLGFVSKEFLFEAQIESSWDIVPTAVAVLVNAVIVGVAGVVTLRPFFMGRWRVRTVRHREVPGLLVGPVVLALLGLVISLEPDWFDRTVLRPAAAAVYGQPVEVRVGLWHGVTPMLLLSATVLGIGALLFVYWVPIHQRLRAETLLDRYEAQHAYDALLRRLEAAGAYVAARVQRADLRQALERELRGKLLRLRQGYAAAAGDEKALGQLASASAGTILVLFRALLTLAGRAVPEAPGALAAEAAGLLGVPAAALTTPVERRAERGWRCPAADVEQYLDAVTRAAEYVDHFQLGDQR